MGLYDGFLTASGEAIDRPGRYPRLSGPNSRDKDNGNIGSRSGGASVKATMGTFVQNETTGIGGKKHRCWGAARAALTGGRRRARRTTGRGSGQKATDLKIKIPNFALVKIIHLLVAVSNTRAIESHGDRLLVDVMAETRDHNCIIPGP